jgi:hypothetical protein
MGFSDAPAPTVLRPTFDDVAPVIDVFIAQRAPGPLILLLARHRRPDRAGKPGELCPLGVPALEDKIVQRATVEVLNTIYEQGFLGFSYGFRPGVARPKHWIRRDSRSARRSGKREQQNVPCGLPTSQPTSRGTTNGGWRDLSQGGAKK